MPLFNWTVENSVGVEELDNQHQKLFSIINKLYDLMTKSETQEGIVYILKELAEYAEYHFKTEEEYFQQFDYENKAEHIQMHSMYGEKIAQFFKDDKSDGGTIVSYGILDFLEDWWLNHINIEDKKYTECLKSHGLK